MFRRRGFARGFGRLFRRGLGGPLAPPADAAVLTALQEAQRIEALGHYTEAAELYERLAYHAQQLSRPRQAGRPRQAARLYLRAAACRIQGEQPGLSFPSIHQAFRILAAAQEWSDLQRLGQRTEAWLRQMGYPTQADELHRRLEDLLAKTPLQLPLDQPAGDSSLPAAAPTVARLPSHCPNCGAALRPNEVEWLDSRTAGCAYCGSPVPTA